VLEGAKPKPASLQVIGLAAPGSAPSDNVAHRIERKFRKDPLGYLITAEFTDVLLGEADVAYPGERILRVIRAYRILRGDELTSNEPYLPWTGSDLEAWQQRCGMRTDAEAAAALAMPETVYRRKKRGRSRIRGQESHLARMTEIGLTPIAAQF